MKSLNYFLLAFILFSNSVFSQKMDSIKPKKSLHYEIKKMDSLLFNVAFNKCDLELYKKIMSPDLEFYDDRSGLNTSFEVEVASFKDRCGVNNTSRIKRVLISTEVFPLEGYGAVQLGVHGFYLPNTSENDIIEVAKFILIWEYKDEKWMIKRVVSYDHKSTKE